MKNLLMYNYNIDADNLIMINEDISYFYIDYDKYYFLKYKRIETDIENIYNNLSTRINMYHYIIKNKEGNIFTKDNNNSYVLLKVNGPENNEIDLHDIISSQFSISNNIDKNLIRTNWGELWSEKVDYLEYQVSELGKDHPTVRKTFSYYIGLAENAIEYFNMLDLDNAMVTYNQRRIKYPNISRNYYNPLNLVIDFRVRDISEYIKTSFFNGGNILEEVKILLNKNVLSNNEYNLLYARLLYPSYYFDDITEILEHNSSDDILLKYVNKTSEYEKFLQDIYHIFSKKVYMIKIDWLIR